MMFQCCGNIVRVQYHLRKQRERAEAREREIAESLNTPSYLPNNPDLNNYIPQYNPVSPYQQELLGMPRKLMLARELYNIFMPINLYQSAKHKNRQSPLTQIYNAYHMKVDTTQWQRNRDNFSRLYKSLRDAEISHRDMLAVVGNPYVCVVKDWRNIPLSKKQILLQEHPEIPELSAFLESMKAEFKSVTPAYKHLNLHEQRIVDEGIEDLSFWFIPALPAKMPAGLRVAYATFKSKVPQIANAYSTKPEFVRNIVNFFKKKANDGVKKASESNAPRIQNTKGEADEYIKGLTAQKGWVLNRGKTKDGYHYYEVMKKFEYKGITFKRGQYISRDTKHHEIEWFRNKNEHMGAIDPVTGKLKPDSLKPDRTLKIK